MVVVLAGCAGDERSDDVGGVAVEGDAGSVVTHGGAWIGVTSGFLNVAQGNTRVERGGDERVTQGVGSDSLGDAGTSGDAPHDPGGGVTVKAMTVGTEEEGSFAAFPDGEVDGSGGAWRERDEDGLGTLAKDGEGAMPALEA